MSNHYWITRRPPTWRLQLGPGGYIRCQDLKELRTAVARMRAEGFRPMRRYEHPHIRRERQLAELSAECGDCDGPALAESVKAVLFALRQHRDPSTAARIVAHYLLDEVGAYGMGGCRLCCS